MILDNFDILNIEAVCKELDIEYLEELRPNTQYSSGTGEQLMDFWLEYNITLTKGSDVFTFRSNTGHKNWFQEELPEELTNKEKEELLLPHKEEFFVWLMSNTPAPYKIIEE